MLTLKLQRPTDSGQVEEKVLSTDEYTITKGEGESHINVVLTGGGEVSNLDFYVGEHLEPDDNRYNVLYVENQSGKTIDRVGGL